MRGLVCVAFVLSSCGAAIAGDTDIGAPWAGSLVIPVKADAGVQMPDIAMARASIAPEPERSAAAEPQPPAPPAKSTSVEQKTTAVDEKVEAPARASIVPPLPSNKKKMVMTGYASYYDFGRLTANGERFYPMGLTAAHRTLPFGTRILVTNKRTGKSVVVRVNDRGPFVRGRAIDLTRGAARAIGLEGAGLAAVTMEVQ